MITETFRYICRSNIIEMKKSFATLLILTSFTLASFAQGYEVSIELMGTQGMCRTSNNYYGINILNGYRIPWGGGLFVGVGSGMEMTSYLTKFVRVNATDGSATFSREREANNFFVPVYGSLQYYLQKGHTNSTFVRLDVGYEFAVFRFDADQKLFDKTACKGGMYVEPSFGINFKQRGADKSRSWYLAVGPNFQKGVFDRHDITCLTEADDSDYIGTAKSKTYSWLLPSLALHTGFRF